MQFCGITAATLATWSLLNDLDLEGDDGEFLILVGPSGCGKSTRALPGWTNPHRARSGSAAAR